MFAGEGGVSTPPFLRDGNEQCADREIKTTEACSPENLFRGVHRAKPENEMKRSGIEYALLSGWRNI